MARPSKKRDGKTSYAGVPRAVMDHPDYVALSYKAKALLLELSYQYRGSNNGDLQASWTCMRERGWRSRTTLHKALDELLSSGLVILTRQGRFVNPGGVCSLYALAWNPIDDCKGKHDVAETRTAPRHF